MVNDEEQQTKPASGLSPKVRVWEGGWGGRPGPSPRGPTGEEGARSGRLEGRRTGAGAADARPGRAEEPGRPPRRPPRPPRPRPCPRPQFMQELEFTVDDIETSRATVEVMHVATKGDLVLGTCRVSLR